MNEELYNRIEQIKPRTAWERGVKEQALELVEQAKVKLTKENAIGVLLNGASDWFEYSLSGNALIYDEDIAERYCTPSELKRNKNGRKDPNPSETWLELQTRALRRAYALIKRNIKKEDIK